MGLVSVIVHEEDAFSLFAPAPAVLSLRGPVSGFPHLGPFLIGIMSRLQQAMECREWFLYLLEAFCKA